jgi:hypothetical protein
MAIYSANSALTFAKRMVKSLPVDEAGVSYQLLDYVAKEMWVAAPWSWTLGTLPTVTVTGAAGTDYSITTPADFLYIVSADLSNGNLTDSLHVNSFNSVNATIVGVPTTISHSTNLLRFFPKPPAGYSKALIARYKKIPPDITVSNVNTLGATGIPDAWCWVYQAGVLYYAYLYADDQRAGTCQIDANGRYAYSGQLAVWQAGIEMMRKAEALPLIYPGVPKTNG